MKRSPLTRVFLTALCAVSLLISQQLCAAEALFTGGAKSHEHSSSGPGHDHDSGHHEHNGDASHHDNSRGSEDSCCKTQSPLSLASNAVFSVAKQLALDITPFFSQLSSFSSLDCLTIEARLSGCDPPMLLSFQLLLLSHLLAPNAPPASIA